MRVRSKVSEKIMKPGFVSPFKFVLTFKFIFFLFAFLSCTEESPLDNQMTKISDVLSYRLISFGENSIYPKEGDLLLLDIEYSNEKDSVFWDSKHHCPQGYFLKYTRKSSNQDFLTQIGRFSIGDSLNFQINTSFFFQSFFQKSTVPQFCKNDSIVKINLKLLKIYDAIDSLELNSIVDQRLDSLKWSEFDRIQTHIQRFNPYPEKLDSCFFMLKLKNNNDSLVKKGKIATLSYRGSFLDGTLFDVLPGNKSFEWKVGERDQLIPGLQIAIQKMRKGEKAKIIIPSYLAFGGEGSSNGWIPPYTPLEYEVEILNLK